LWGLLRLAPIIEYPSIYFSLQVASGHHFHPAPPQVYTDEHREHPKLPIPKSDENCSLQHSKNFTIGKTGD